CAGPDDDLVAALGIDGLTRTQVVAGIAELDAQIAIGRLVNDVVIVVGGNTPGSGLLAGGRLFERQISGPGRRHLSLPLLPWRPRRAARRPLRLHARSLLPLAGMRT